MLTRQLDQVPPPGPPWGFHVRIASVTVLLTLFDSLLFMYATESVLVDGVSAMLLFASEFAILLVAIAGTWARYTVGIIDLRRAGGRADAPTWEEKSMYLFYIDLAAGKLRVETVPADKTDFAKLLTYLIFFIVIYLNYGLPVYILRDVYMTLRSLVSRGGDLVRYRRATRNMDQLYPDATAEELERMGDHTCIICREEMIPRESQPQDTPQDGPNETPKKLACGHIFHFHCLRSWLERQQSCPTCRRDVLGAAVPPNQRDRDARNNAAAARQNAPNAAAPAPQPAAGVGAAPDAPDPTRALFEEYFRLPGVNGDAPVPVATGAAVPTGAAQPEAAAAETDDHRVQRSIWGAPIVPGRFVPPALGASPRWPETGASREAGPSRTARIVTTSGAGSSSAPVESPNISSGVTTPLASRAPEVFSTGGSPMRNTQVQEPETATEDVLEEDDDEHKFDDEDIPIREAVRLAALRRAGALASSSTSSSASSFAAVDKGKGKAVEPTVEPETASTVPFDAPPTHRAYLAPASPFPNISLASLASTAATRDPSLLPSTPEAVRAALNERLGVLREVDDVVWQLVGELSRLKSAWEVEDGADRTGASAAVSGAASPAPTPPVARDE